MIYQTASSDFNDMINNFNIFNRSSHSESANLKMGAACDAIRRLNIHYRTREYLI